MIVKFANEQKYSFDNLHATMVKRAEIAEGDITGVMPPSNIFQYSFQKISVAIFRLFSLLGRSECRSAE